MASIYHVVALCAPALVQLRGSVRARVHKSAYYECPLHVPSSPITVLDKFDNNLISSEYVAFYECMYSGGGYIFYRYNI